MNILSDYIFVSEKGICRKCWKFIGIAVKIIDTALDGTVFLADFFKCI